MANVEKIKGENKMKDKTNNSNKKCPNCKSRKIVSCKGGTNLKPNPKINWLCSKCLWEW